MRIICSIWLVFGIAYSTTACDICGCGAGTSYIGILPKFQKSFVGVRYQFQQFNSKPHSLFSEHYGPSQEYFHSTDLWGRFVLTKKIQIFAFVPFHYNYRFENENYTQTFGLSDIQAKVNFVLFSSKNNEIKKWKHLIQAGAGIKLPTGKSNLVQDGLMVNENLQLGTGSIDFPIHGIYTLRNKHIGFNLEANYKLNGKNKMSYQFGNRMNSSLKTMYWIEKGNATFLPSFGCNAEWINKDNQYNEINIYSGGYTIQASAGMDIYLKQFGFGLNLNQPIIQKLGSGYVHSKTNLSANFIYLF